MRAKLRHDLHQLLTQERISLESGIVNYITYQLAGIAATERQLSAGFSLSLDRWMSAEEREKITFSIASQCNLEQIETLMVFFNLPKSSYQHAQPLVLNAQQVFEQFMPQFQAYFQQMKITAPEILTKYRILSAPILESTALSTLRKYIDETRQILLSEALRELTPTMKALVDFTLLLSGRMEALNTFPLFYKDILNSREALVQFLQQAEIGDNEDLAPKLKTVLEGMQLYETYHRNESVLCIKAFTKEFEVFLEPYRITTKKCDMLEHTLLSLAEATMRSNQACQFIPGHDRSRLVINFGDIDQANTTKIIHYFRTLGDETASEGYGARHHGSAIESMSGAECAELSKRPYHRSKEEPETESHSVEIDGKFLYNVVFPQLKAKIATLPAGDLLKYQILSKNHFQPKDAAPLGTLSLFKPAADSDSESDEVNLFEFSGHPGTLDSMMS
ncbi:MAG: hypothetical protein ACHP65_04515 [Legionellales bacterium]